MKDVKMPLFGAYYCVQGARTDGLCLAFAKYESIYCMPFNDIIINN